LGFHLSLGIAVADIDDIVVGESSFEEIEDDFGPAYSRGRSPGSEYLVSSKHRSEDIAMVVSYGTKGKVAEFEGFGEIRKSRVEKFIKNNDTLSSLGNVTVEENVTRGCFDQTTYQTQAKATPRGVNVYIQYTEDEKHVFEYWEAAEPPGKIIYVSYKKAEESKEMSAAQTKKR